MDVFNELQPRDTFPRGHPFVRAFRLFVQVLREIWEWLLGKRKPPVGVPYGTSAFIRPIGGSPPISDDFNEHVARGSVNPGTDYAVGRGTAIVAPSAGTVKVADNSTGGAGGRTVNIFFDNGWSGDFLHLNSLNVGLGQHVSQGQVIGYTGGSANGSESGVGNHLHFSLRTVATTCFCNSGNVDPETQYGPISLSPTQRQVKPGGPEVLRRVTPDTSQPDIDPDLQPGEVGNFNGWINGENVGGNPMWYRGVSGNWFWSGGFTEISGHDLEDLNAPAPTDPKQRVVLSSAPARFRSGPSTTAATLGEYPAGSVQTFTYWTKGELVSGIDTWYVDEAKGKFSWSGGYTSQSKDGLTEYDSGPVPPPTWPSTPYTFAAAGAFVTSVQGADWSNFENEWSVPNADERKGFPDDPSTVVIHQWGNPGDYLISSVINTFKARHENTGDRVSAHFVVDAGQIVQMVSLDDRAYHAGSGGNDFVGIEADPYISEKDAQGELTARALAIIDNVRKILIYLGQRNDNVALTNMLHKNVTGASTSCGTWIEPVLPQLDVSDDLEPEPPEPPPSDDVPEWFARYVDGQIKALKNYQKGK